MEKCPDDLGDKEEEEKTETENEFVIHRDITKNETETNQDNLNKVIEESPNNSIFTMCDDF